MVMAVTVMALVMGGGRRSVRVWGSVIVVIIDAVVGVCACGGSGGCGWA